ncbi:hypothetical protein SNE40_019836 [Patella caerulea]|uniref:Peptidase C76 domain-containing protein n=1 Tax=Patella caerulea TaxID=87958 RepID=A0AAN8GJP1_PATCE
MPRKKKSKLNAILNLKHFAKNNKVESDMTAKETSSTNGENTAQKYLQTIMKSDTGNETSCRKEICKSKVNYKYVYGSFHQADVRFGVFSGTQCTGNSLVAVLFSCIKPVHIWNTNDLDKILIAGNELYSFLQSSSSMHNRYILISELPRSLIVFEKLFNIDIQLDSVVGLMRNGDSTFEYNEVSMTLYEALQTCLLQYESCFITFGGNTFVIMKRNEMYYIFDSHSRSSVGLLTADGTSVLIEYKGIIDVYTHCCNLAESMEIGVNTQFEVTGINVIKDAIHEHDELSINENSSEISSDKVLNEIGGDVFLSHVETSNFFFHTLGLDEQIRICTQLNIVNRLDSNYSNQSTITN